MSFFVHAQGIKTVHTWGGSNKGKFLSTQLLNDPKEETNVLQNETGLISKIFLHSPTQNAHIQANFSFGIGCLYVLTWLSVLLLCEGGNKAKQYKKRQIIM